MKRFLLGAAVVLLTVVGVRYCENRQSEREQLAQNSQLIQEQIKNVGKLVVTEGNFSQVWSYKDSKKFYLDVFSARKKALIVVNAKVTVSYDLSKLETEIDKENKRVIIKSIPKEELNIYPDIQYYDVTQDYLNQFEASDYNTIKKKVTASIKKKVEASSIKSNAQNRLISELSKIYILTNSMGWTLEYNDMPVNSQNDFSDIKL
ncbi:MAG: DUF4230 domain-containing protein [Zunongwangia sp.]|jgi:hypothetical protein|uniref:DUF4230 domain-containing protein n=2 Tax=Zunongwangia profunda TaxID=398743 RepID=D5BGI1_ZUNPS|nr:DUF4230 domain-containing protein [Zunongwangia profunda]MAO37538.1 DUF4230 domain-containing protein [Zunongwangia sp.]ADF51140.1 conserved hypothetical protein [Zunongwangia profunda SM-A87]MAS72936.1 DUF4230 domain-containing protein [Zunongwangia sp.]MCC4229722.1 DUF4230 domain-containing protein [Zunongwangia profunda]HCV82748.1 DUF4230 domain-containing protein [Zunongwangia profunda]|tara:strand:+ start:2190 stop:2804 length:615 start_codon:yes stop_codon:yes gene_type:complete